MCSLRAARDAIGATCRKKPCWVLQFRRALLLSGKLINPSYKQPRDCSAPNVETNATALFYVSSLRAQTFSWRLGAFKISSESWAIPRSSKCQWGCFSEEVSKQLLKQRELFPLSPSKHRGRGKKWHDSFGPVKFRFRFPRFTASRDKTGRNFRRKPWICKNTEVKSRSVGQPTQTVNLAVSFAYIPRKWRCREILFSPVKYFFSVLTLTSSSRPTQYARRRSRRFSFRSIGDVDCDQRNEYEIKVLLCDAALFE